MHYKSLIPHIDQSLLQVCFATQVQPSTPIKAVLKANFYGIQLCNDLILEVHPGHVRPGFKGMFVAILIYINIKQPNFRCVSGECFTQIKCKALPLLTFLFG
jgi:hypothetical protein